ncbi:MAG: sulfatase-like hydrolase/transferase [Roseibacillus sp.]|nr:sulfatase-like hydrolase/transferase [Roseibacillus sp.]
MYLRLKIVLLLLLFGLLQSPKSLAERPNILLIYTDDQGSADARCYGALDLQTPAMDGLARQGVRFTQMLAPAAVCSPSRAGLLGGCIPMRLGAPGNISSARGGKGLSPDLYLLPEALRDAGYRTHHVGKWHLGYTDATMPNAQGFDSSFGHMGGCIDNYSHFFYWNGPNRHDLWRNGQEVWRDGEGFGDLMVEEAKAVIASEDKRPFFIYWAINWPHYPLQGSDKWRTYYRSKKLAHPRDKYAAFLSTMDELIGQVVAHLNETGKRNNTIVILQSDHGHSVEERTFGGGGSSGPFRGHKFSFLEGGLRVPSIISWPGTLPEGEVREQFVTGCDWYPTLAKWVKAPLPKDMKLDGKDINAVIRSSDTPSPHKDFFWTQDFSRNKNASWAVRQGDWKLLRRPLDQVTPWKSGKAPGYLLVNLAEDPGESTNLADRDPARLAELKDLARRYQEDLLPDFREARK